MRYPKWKIKANTGYTDISKHPYMHLALRTTRVKTDGRRDGDEERIARSGYLNFASFAVFLSPRPGRPVTAGDAPAVAGARLAMLLLVRLDERREEGRRKREKDRRGFKKLSTRRTAHAYRRLVKNFFFPGIELPREMKQENLSGCRNRPKHYVDDPD